MDTRFKAFVSVVLAVFFAACSKAENPPSEYTLACVQDVSYTADGQCMDIYYAGNLEPGKKLPVMGCAWQRLDVWRQIAMDRLACRACVGKRVYERIRKFQHGRTP